MDGLRITALPSEQRAVGIGHWALVRPRLMDCDHGGDPIANRLNSLNSQLLKHNAQKAKLTPGGQVRRRSLQGACYCSLAAERASPSGRPEGCPQRAV